LRAGPDTIDLNAFDAHLPALDLQAGNDAQQVDLPQPAADQGDELAIVDRQIDPLRISAGSNVLRTAFSSIFAISPAPTAVQQ
jgi:hypothetical protein